MKVKDIITEGTFDSVNQLVADIRHGLIDANVVQAVKNFMMKKMGAITEPEVEEPAQQPAEPAQKPVTAKATQPTAPAQPAPAVQPAQPTGPIGAPNAVGVTEAKAKPKQVVDIDINADFEKVLRTNFAADADNILTFVYRTNIQSICKEIAVNKQFKPEAADLLASLFYEAPGSLHDRNNLAMLIRDQGVLDLKKFAKPGSGDIMGLVQAKYRSNSLVRHLVSKLLNRKDFPTQVSSANKGAGEDMITILGNPVLKLSPGDLNVGGLEVEVKAQGARLKGFGGGTIYGNGATIYPKWVSLISSALGTKGMATLAEFGLSLKNYLNFGDKTLAALSAGLANGNGRNKKETVREAFDIMLEHVYPRSTKQLRARVLDTIKANGSFNTEDFRRAWFLFSYDYYKLTTTDAKTKKAMDSIMFIHQPTETYKFVVDANDFDFDKFTIDTSIYNWTDAPSVAPKITFGKEIRDRRSRAKAK